MQCCKSGSDAGSRSVRVWNFYPPGSGSGSEISWWVESGSRSRSEIIIGDQSGLSKNKCSDKNTIYNIKSLISAQKWPCNVHSDLKCENFTKISQTRIWIRILKEQRGGSGSAMTLQVRSGSEINSFGQGCGSETINFWSGPTFQSITDPDQDPTFR